MNLDYRFPLFDTLLHGRLNPLMSGNELDGDYEIRLQQQIVATTADPGVYELKFIPSLNVKCLYYRRLLISETFLYCEELLTILQEEEDERIRAFLLDAILNKHLTTCLKKVGERIRQNGFHIAQLIHPAPEADIEFLSNVYVFHLLKICIAKAYLEIQESLSDVVVIRQSEAMLYSSYLSEIPPVNTFLIKRSGNNPVKPPHNYPAPELEKQTVSQPAKNPDDAAGKVIEFLTIKEVSDILRVDERTVRRRIKNGDITAFKSGGKHLIDKNLFEKYLKDKNQS